MENKIFKNLYRFTDFIFDSVSYTEDSVNLFFHRDKRKSMDCPHCGKRMGRNRMVSRTVYDLPIGSAMKVRVQITTVQGKCSKCGCYKTFLPEEINENATATRRFQKYISSFCHFTSPTELAWIYPFSDDTIRRWDQEILREEFGKVNLDGVRNLLIDEKSIGKHHHYVTLVLNGDTGELLYMYSGKGYASLKPFFEEMTQKQRENIQTACMDRNASYPKAVNEYCPNAIVIYDKFHIVQNLNESVDQVRREETSKAEKEHKPIIKGGRFL